MPLPNFFIIGAAKAGTTGLYHTLKQHPQIYMSPVKEPRYFILKDGIPDYCGPGDQKILRNSILTYEEYTRLFEDARHETALGEATVGYLAYSSKAAPSIKQYVPHARLIAILRQPADRAYSHYLMHFATGREILSFPQALAVEEERQSNNWAKGWRYKGNGYYHRLLQPFYHLFPSGQIRIYLYDDWKAKPAQMLQDLLRYLGVDESFTPAVIQRNTSWLPRSRAVQALLSGSNPLKIWLKRWLPPQLWRGVSKQIFRYNQKRPPRIDPEIRRQLTAEYRDDLLALQDLIQRDLSDWLKG